MWCFLFCVIILDMSNTFKIIVGIISVVASIFTGFLLGLSGLESNNVFERTLGQPLVTMIAIYCMYLGPFFFFAYLFSKKNLFFWLVIVALLLAVFSFELPLLIH